MGQSIPAPEQPGQPVEDAEQPLQLAPQWLHALHGQAIEGEPIEAVSKAAEC